jgi:hypothetical protein
MSQKRNNLRTPSGEQTRDSGLVAIASSGTWDISIDESLEERHQWYAQIEGPSVSLYFELIEPGIIAKVVDFLGRRNSYPPSSQVLKRS